MVISTTNTRYSFCIFAAFFLLNYVSSITDNNNNYNNDVIINVLHLMLIRFASAVVFWIVFIKKCPNLRVFQFQFNQFNQFNWFWCIFIIIDFNKNSIELYSSAARSFCSFWCIQTILTSFRAFNILNQFNATFIFFLCISSVNRIRCF